MTFTVIRIISVILAIVGTTFLIPISFAAGLKEYSVIPSFLIPMAVSWILGFIFIIAGKNKKTYLSTRAGFVVVALGWFCASLFGAIPFYASGTIPSFVDAFFESVSGFTTTGATILSEIETLPVSINLWRCQTHWLGGMGIVALTVALLPILGVGGFQLIKAETTGPEKGKLTPKITTTAKALWFIYVGLTAIQVVLLKTAGMNWAEALSHSFATVGTGGFSTRNASIQSFNSPYIDAIITVFMFLAGINFSLYYYLLTRKIDDIKSNTELKVYVLIVSIAVISVTLIEAGYYGGFLSSFRYSSFQVLSIISTTGFATWDFTTWEPAAQAIIFFLFFIGGCSGSTSGGIKIIRWTILGKQLKNEILKMIHPHGIFTVRLNGKAGRKDVVFSVAAFFCIYLLMLAVTTFITTLFGIDVFTSFTGALSMAGNIGPGFSLLGPSCNYGFLPSFVKIWYSIIMIAGRLEFFTIVILFSSAFWKK